MAEASLGSSSPVGSLSSEDHDFDPTAEMLVHEYDDERTLEEEESQEGSNISSELADLEKEGNMPLDELLAMYRCDASAGSSVDSSSGDLTDELPDMTLDKEEIAKDLLSGDYEEETQSSADDLTPSVTSHETTDFFPRTLRSNAISDGDKESDCDDDGPSPEDSRKEIQVGSEYQADVPSCLCHYKDGENVYELEDELMWSPCSLSESKVRSFLLDAALRATDEKLSCDRGVTVRDNEQALHELVKSNYNTREALERYCSQLKSSKEKSPPWSEDECKNFEHALQMYDKNFHLIQKHKVPSRTVAECVAFYYMWKKSERFDFFVQQNRFGKKKYSSYPGVTDLMDRLVDEAEGLAVDSSSSVCSGGGRLEATTEQQLSLLNSITASDLTALSNSVATVCSPAEVGCLDSYSFPLESLHRGPLESLHRGPLESLHRPLSHDEPLGFGPGSGDPDCLNMLDAGFYHAELGCERPTKRLKMDSFMSPSHHRISGAKMAVSVTDFSGAEPFLSAHGRHHTTHAALQSE
ncbi:unnamed protein product [Knipowitschia caucasica]